MVRKLLAVCPKTVEKEKEKGKTRMAVSKLFVLPAKAKLHLVTRKKLPRFTQLRYLERNDNLNFTIYINFLVVYGIWKNLNK